MNKINGLKGDRKLSEHTWLMSAWRYNTKYLYNILALLPRNKNVVGTNPAPSEGVSLCLRWLSPGIPVCSHTPKTG